VSRRAPEAGLCLKRIDCPLEQLMYKFPEGTGVETQWLVILVPGMPSQRVSPDEGERIAQH
jgi:hypothetical protein